MYMPMPERDTVAENRTTPQNENEFCGLSLTDLIRPSERHNGRSLEKKIQDEVDTLGKDGGQALLDAVSKYRVVGVAEIHTGKGYPNSVLYMLTKMMPEFKKAGVTHLALEVNKRNHQSILNEIMKTKSFNPETGKGIAFNEDWIKFLEAAATNGIKLVGVDDNPDRPSPDLTIEENQHRETFMAKEIADIVDSDKSARVLWPVGDLHMTRRPGTNGYRWAGQQISEHGKKNGWSLATFQCSMAGPFDRFQSVKVDKPTSVDLKDSKTLKQLGAKTPQMKDPRMPDSKVGDFDSILFVPWNLQLMQAEKEFGRSEKLLPLLEHSIETYGINIPGHTLELCKKALPIEEKVHGIKSPQVALRLLLMAKCCSLLNREEEATKYSAQGSKMLQELGK